MASSRITVGQYSKLLQALDPNLLMVDIDSNGDGFLGGEPSIVEVHESPKGNEIELCSAPHQYCRHCAENSWMKVKWKKIQVVEI